MNKAERMEVSRTRPSGHTVVTVPGEGVVDALRRLVETSSYGIVNGMAVDVFSASVVCLIYDKVNDANKAKLAAMPVEKLVKVCYATMNRYNAIKP